MSRTFIDHWHLESLLDSDSFLLEQEDVELEDLYESLLRRGSYSFSNLCEAADSISREYFTETRHRRQPIDRFNLKSGDRIDWFNGNGYIKCRVVSIDSTGVVKVRGIQDKIYLAIYGDNEDEFFYA